MRLGLAIVVLAFAFAAGAAAKAPPTGIELCGTNGCAGIAFQSAEHLFTLGGAPRAPARPGPFFRLRWTWDTGQEELGGYWLPDQDSLRLGGWVVPDGPASATLAAAAGGLEPFATPTPTGARVGGRVAADPGSYARLLDAGSRVSTWVGAIGWIRVELASSEPSPWTDGALDLRISKRAGFVWRDGAVYQIPLALARLARLGRSLAPTPSPAGFAALGAPGCAPSSPRRAAEVFGTATSAQLWARVLLPTGSAWADRSDASLTGAVGKDVEIDFRFTAASLRPIATAAGGAQIRPDWGPTAHGSSTWKRPGSEWGVGYTFPAPGCWRIHVGDGTVAGDLWLDVES